MEKIEKHLFIPDCQVKPGVPLEHLTWIGKYIVAKKPDVIVCIGDFADMESLCSYDKGKKSFEGRRYKADMAAARKGMDLLLKPLKEYNEHQRQNNKKQYKPRMVMTLGNHEYRIERAVENQAELDGVIGYKDLPYEDWEVHDFLKPVFISGVCYTHYMANPMTGNPYTGMSSTILKTVGHSFVVGHAQKLEVATRTLITGEQQWGIIAGACLTPDHKVLTHDLKYVELGSVKIGDKLTSFDENSNDSVGRSRRFKTGTVTNIRKRIRPVYKVTLQTGKEFKVTSDHLWLTKLGSALLWKTTEDLRKGTRIPKILDEWESDNSYDGDWLAGMYDGKGCYYTRSTSAGVIGQLTISQKTGPILEKIKNKLFSLIGLENISSTDNRKDVVSLRIKKGLRGIASVLGQLRPERLLSKFKPEHLGRLKTSEEQVDTVISKEYLGAMDIIEIEIDSKTMIVEGYPHHNCYLHDEDYKGYQGNNHWRGVIMLHRVQSGSFDPCFISLDYLRDRFSSED